MKKNKNNKDLKDNKLLWIILGVILVIALIIILVVTHMSKLEKDILKEPHFRKSQVFFRLFSEKYREKISTLCSARSIMIYAKRWPERAICAILPPRQDAPEGRAYALHGT